MKKTTLLTIYCLLFTVCSSFAQVPADSLTGTYAGQYWYANPYTNPWTIQIDTLYVISIDTINCIVSENDAHFGGNYSLYTDYYSCNGPAPSNAYAKFYSGDSARFITDDYPQPPPNQPISLRFYGIRVSNKIITAINGFEDNKQLSIYPNPCNGMLTIECPLINGEGQIEITDILGREIKNEDILVDKEIKLNVSDLKKGVYFIQFKTSKTTLTRKLIKN